ncbi:MAG: N-acetyltransferase family protein [Anaerolineae bacterium]|nr:N-acetyltransferase family protein [Anaerolineae bacterium]
MQNQYFVRPLNAGDGKAVMEIFNYYIENSFAAYPEHRLPEEFYEKILFSCQGYPTAALTDVSDALAGFGFLRAYNPMPAFKKTAEISYFIKPGQTGQGLGKLMLDYLTDNARKMGISCILAGISSLNDPSLKFHQKNGFSHCGRFAGVGIKQGLVFDVVWMQKQLE